MLLGIFSLNHSLASVSLLAKAFEDSTLNYPGFKMSNKNKESKRNDFPPQRFLYKPKANKSLSIPKTAAHPKCFKYKTEHSKDAIEFSATKSEMTDEEEWLTEDDGSGSSEDDLSLSFDENEEESIEEFRST
ncbi:hypothetical protein CDAR_120681, partial [Caerostris darwini]